MLPIITRSAPAAFADSASDPPNCPIWIWFASSAALVCAPPLIACMSTSRPRSLKMPFSNAYHMTQSSALTLLYAAMTFLQHAIGLSAVPLDAVAWACVPITVVGVAVDAGCPPHAATRIAVTAAKTASLSLISTSRLAFHLWSPALEPVLYTLQQPREEHARARDEDHGGEHLGHLERHAVVGDELADAMACRDELADDDAGESVTDAEAEAGEDERHRAGQHDASEDERLGCAERLRDA